jgi:pyroglutamyl-peptidase
METVLLTGFAPFGGEPVNPSFEIARALDGRTVRGRRIVARELPCVFGEALSTLDDAIACTSPCLVLALGQAASRSEISIERVAINVDDAPIPDNAGAQPVDRPVVAGGPAAHFSTLPVKAIVAALHAAGLPAHVSQTAGTYVCNHVFYGLQHRLAGTAVPAGFIHVPLMDEQAARRAASAGADTPVAPAPRSLPLAAMIEAVRIALDVSLAARDGVAVGAGAAGEGSIG